MATVYVSQTATNGYAVGSDANSGATKELAKLTISAAITAAAANDTVIVNDGTYVSATYHDIAKGLTLAAETDYGVTLKCAAGQSQVIRVGAAGAEITLGKLIIDAENNAAASCVGLNGTTARTVTLSGTRLQNAGTDRFAIASITSGMVIALNVNGVDVSCSSTAGGVYALLGAGAHVAINGLNCDNTAGPGAASSARCPVYINATAAATACIKGVSGTWKTSSGAISASFIRTSGVRAIIEQNRGMVLSGGDTNGAIVRCENTSGVQSDSICIRNNSGENNTSGKFLILVGADGASANDNKTNYATIYGNEVSSNGAATLMHGIFIGNSKGGLISGNVIRNAAIPTISKLCSEAVYIVDNDIISPYTGTSGCCRSKGSTNTQIVGNRVVLSSGKTNPVIVIDRDPTIPTLSSGCSAVGNTVYSSVTVPVMVSVGGASDASAATFMGNNYRSPAGYSAGAFVYQASSYNTVALWSAAQEKSALDADPTKSDASFWRDAYVPMLQSALSAAYPHLLPIY